MDNSELTIDQTQEWLEVGTITSPQGLKGELRVYPDTDFPERFTQAGIRWLKHPQTGAIAPAKLQGGRFVAGKNLYIIKLEGVENRSQAEELRDYKILVDKSDRPKLRAGEYHVADLVGLEIYHQKTGENIGVVVDLYSAGNDLLEIKLHQQPEVEPKSDRDLSNISRRSKRKKFRPKSNKPITVFVPFVKEIVPVVDIANQRMEISPPDGLLNIHDLDDSKD
jgi:16S rRNA processing protein RimM